LRSQDHKVTGAGSAIRRITAGTSDGGGVVSRSADRPGMGAEGRGLRSQDQRVTGAGSAIRRITAGTSDGGGVVSRSADRPGMG
jgi:hypothetical protein